MLQGNLNTEEILLSIISIVIKVSAAGASLSLPSALADNTRPLINPNIMKNLIQ